MASKKLDMEEVPCIVLEGLTEAQKKAYVIADNKMALNAGWDEELLKLELENLKELDFDLDLTGFKTNEIDALLEFNIDGEDYGTDFELPDGDTPQTRTITLSLSEEQYQIAMSVIDFIESNEIEVRDFGNHNKKSNILFESVVQWAEQKKLL